MKEKYFHSPEFLKHKRNMNLIVKDYNDISSYLYSLPNNNKFIPDNKSNYSNLATFENTSRHNYRRDRYKKHLYSDNVYSASLQVVRRASEQPIKYLCKYFNIKPTVASLNQLEEIGTNISRIENTVYNLEQRKYEIEHELNPPKLITKYYMKELLKETGMVVPNIQVHYATYTFEYVSAGGNSSQKSTITFNGRTVEAVSAYILDRIKYR